MSIWSTNTTGENISPFLYLYIHYLDTQTIYPFLSLDYNYNKRNLPNVLINFGFCFFWVSWKRPPCLQWKAATFGSPHTL